MKELLFEILTPDGYVKNGFDDLLFASWVTLVSSGIVLLYKK